MARRGRGRTAPTGLWHGRLGDEGVHQINRNCGSQQWILLPSKRRIHLDAPSCQAGSRICMLQPACIPCSTAYNAAYSTRLRCPELRA